MYEAAWASLGNEPKELDPKGGKDPDKADQDVKKAVGDSIKAGAKDAGDVRKKLVEALAGELDKIVHGAATSATSFGERSERLKRAIILFDIGGAKDGDFLKMKEIRAPLQGEVVAFTAVWDKTTIADPAKTNEQIGALILRQYNLLKQQLVDINDKIKKFKDDKAVFESKIKVLNDEKAKLEKSGAADAAVIEGRVAKLKEVKAKSIELRLEILKNVSSEAEPDIARRVRDAFDRRLRMEFNCSNDAASPQCALLDRIMPADETPFKATADAEPQNGKVIEPAERGREQHQGKCAGDREVKL